MARMRLKIPFSLILILVSTTTMMVSAQLLKHDASLRKACNQTGGIFQARLDDQDIKGDKCAMPFSVATRDDDDAREFCELYAPWRLEKAVKSVTGGRPVTTCNVEATLICKGGWVQMFGRCFLMPKKEQVDTLQEAEATCKKHDSQIAFMHHRYIVGVWKRYFKKISQIWVRATETWDQYIQDAGAANGSALALAFTGKHYEFSVPHNSLIKINPDIRLQILCEYEPPMTPAEINYLGRRYSEIYYPTVPVDNGILVRTASSYTRSSSNLEVCKKALLPFKIEVVGPFSPDSETLKRMVGHSPPRVLLTRAGAEARIDENGMESPQCKEQTQQTYRFEVKVPDTGAGDFQIKNVNDKITCDNMLSTAITHFEGKVPELKIMSDSRSLPIWCKLGHPAKFTFTPPPKDYKVFIRENGEPVAHKLFTQKVPYDKAKKLCEDEGSVLSGINSKKEGTELLSSLAEAAKVDVAQYWLGGRRKAECADQIGFHPDESNKCARNKVIQWQDNVAKEFYHDWWKDGVDHQNPSYWKKNQQCLTYVHGTPGWANPKSYGFLDDMDCYTPHGFFCMKYLKVIKVDS